MTNLVHPELFSQHFSCTSKDFADAGLIEPILNCDTALFVDPTLVESSSYEVIRTQGLASLTSTYKNIIKLVGASKGEGDVAWRAARKQLNLDEFPETHLGYGKSRISGSSRPMELRDAILRTVKEIIDLGESDPSLLSLVGLFEEGVGPDTIGDFTSHCISDALIDLSADFYKKLKLPTKAFEKFGGSQLVADPYDAEHPILVVPQDIVRDLPLAVDWSDVAKAISQADEIKEQFDRFFIGVAQPTITDKKAALKQIALGSRKMLRLLIDALLELATNYDPNEDAFNYYALRSVLSGEIDTQIPSYPKPRTESLDTLHEVVLEIVQHFKKQIESNNLWELLWNDERPKRERASQLVFFAVADVFCKLNNIDISPEANMGGGPVDFKFSSGYRSRVVVELKKSSGTVVHGYKKQLEIYKDAAETDRGIFVVVNIGKLKNKLKQIEQIQGYRRSTGKVASDIILIDATRRSSASKA